MKGRPKVFKMQEGDSRPVTRATAARIAAGVREGGTDPYDERMDTNPPGDVSVRSGSVNPDTVPSVLAGGGANDPYDDEESDPGYFAPMPRQVSGTYGDPKALTHEAVQRIVAELEEAGYLTRKRHGRENRYIIHRQQPLRHVIEMHHTVGDLLDSIAD